jgi:release factor glutamine methyltransferase
MSDDAATPPSHTIRTLLDVSAQHMRQRGFEFPDRECQLLLGHVLAMSRIDLFCNFDRPVTPDETTRFRALYKRRLAHEPVAYLIGEVSFYHRNFKVDARVLIPRPETEFVVDRVVRAVKGDRRRDDASESAGAPEANDGGSDPARGPSPRIADIGTGSGAIAITLALDVPGASVVATDLSADALAVARDNAARLKATIDFREGDLLAPLAGDRFDVIVSNPPYIAPDERESIMPDVRDFEPHLALFSDAGRDAISERLIAGAAAHLNDGGWLILEMGADQSEALATFARASGAWREPQIEPDLAGIPRVLALQRASGA